MNAPNILIVDDDPGTVQVLARMVADLGEVLVATTGDEALALARKARPDLLLLDANLPGLDGLEVCARLKADPETADIPVIFVTANSQVDFEISGFDAGAADFIAKPASGPVVRARVRTQLRLKRLSDELRRTASHDVLTGLANRRRFDEMLRRELAIAHRLNTSLALLMVDVDHFKRYNDHYGHVQGDECLRRIADAIGGSCHRPGDVAARYGGEEFALILPQTHLAGSATMARRLLDAVAALDLPHAALGPSGRVSVSIGAASRIGASTAVSDFVEVWTDDKVDADQLIGSADKALYEAKRSGRNRACAFDPADVAAAGQCHVLALPSQAGHLPP